MPILIGSLQDHELSCSKSFTEYSHDPDHFRNARFFQEALDPGKDPPFTVMGFRDESHHKL